MNTQLLSCFIEIS